MYITNISKAKAHFSALIEKVLVGEEIIIGKAGKPVAKLVRYKRSEEQRQPGALKGKIKIAEAILNKPDKLDTEEFNKMQEHADAGYKICLPLEKVLGNPWSLPSGHRLSTRPGR